jgi:hypothetical protein
MNTTEPGEGELWSEGVSSELVPRAVWKLKVYPNGSNEEHSGKISVFLCLTGPMVGRSGSTFDMLRYPDACTSLQKDSEETLEATYHHYLICGPGGTIDSIKRSTRNFGKSWGWHGSHNRVKKALHTDGSLLVAADFDFLPPDDGGAKVICEATTLQGYEDLQQWAAKFSELHGDKSSSDCTIQVRSSP